LSSPRSRSRRSFLPEALVAPVVLKTIDFMAKFPYNNFNKKLFDYALSYSGSSPE